jgi:hypothetical protein
LQPGGAAAAVDAAGPSTSGACGAEARQISALGFGKPALRRQALFRRGHLSFVIVAPRGKGDSVLVGSFPKAMHDPKGKLPMGKGPPSAEQQER